jgi:hypothetical protein
MLGNRFQFIRRRRSDLAVARLRVSAIMVALVLVLGGGSRSLASEASAEATRQHLYAATLEAGVAELSRRAADDPDDMEARFGLGMLQFVRAVERLGRAQYRYGLHTVGAHVSLPLLRYPIPTNPHPEAIDYDTFRSILQIFIDDLAASEATLAGLGERQATLVVDLMQVRLDIAGASKPDEFVRLVDLLAVVTGRAGSWPPSSMKALEVKFDSGDAAWLRGYTQALSALCEFLLAHDFRPSFDAMAPHFWARAAVPHASELPITAPEGSPTGLLPNRTLWADLVAAVHELRWPVVAPERLRAVRERLLAMIADSRLSWRLIEAETGDDREWIPNPRQKNAALGVLVSREQLTAWFAALDEAEAILEGKKLVPHWRFSKGLDMKAFFERPQTFDLVLLLTGQGALPFLADGEIVTAEQWGEITRAFQGDFFQYALWFN